MNVPFFREKAMQEGLKKAVLVPMKLAMTASALFAPLQELAQLGNINCKSDLQVIFIIAELVVEFSTNF